MQKEKKYTFDDIADYAFSYNLPIRTAVFLVVFITNIFWGVTNLISISSYKSEQLPALIIIAVMIVFSLVALLISGLSKKYNAKGLLRYITLVYMLFLAVEIVVVVAEKFPGLVENGEHLNGVPLITLYLIMFIFLPMQTLAEEIYVCAVIIAAVVAPRFMPCGDRYDMIPCLVAGICFAAGCLIYRAVFLHMAYDHVELLNERKNKENLLQNSMEALSISIEAKNDYLKGHSKRVGIYAKLIGARLGFSEEIQNGLLSAGYLHDVGKIGTSDSILNKPSKLTDDEFVEIKDHPVEGYTIVSKLGAVPDIAAAVRSHHEKFDGNGYPDGISGDDIPLFGRILCVADSCDAMSSTRPYRGALSEQVIIEELEKGCGTQFDPDIARVMIGLIKDGTMRKVINMYQDEEKAEQEIMQGTVKE